MQGFRILCAQNVQKCAQNVHKMCTFCAFLGRQVLTSVSPGVSPVSHQCLTCVSPVSHQCLTWAAGRPGTTFAGQWVTPQDVKQTSKKQMAQIQAQRVKTRGSNPNPTAQAQSKCCLPLFTKIQNIIKILPTGLPNPMLFWYVFQAFS